MKKLALLSLVTFFTISGNLNAAESKKGGDAAIGKTLTTTCVACHGADGNSVNPEWPKLAGQGEAYLAKQLYDYRNDRRVNPSMTAMAKGIKTDADVAHLAAYFASEKAKPGTANKEKIAQGEAIYKGGIVASGVGACAGCHGPTGNGNPAAKFPKISGQHAKYIVAQLKAFKAGKRANDAGKMMRNIAMKMTDAEMEAVAEYIAGLRE